MKRLPRFRRFWLWAAVLILLLPVSGASGSEAVPSVQSIQDAAGYLDFPAEGKPAEVVRGRIRYITQTKDAPYFLEEYWIGGNKGELFDLTLRRIGGKSYSFWCGNMCTRAVYSMALSYLGYDCTPGGMSLLLGKRDIDAPYDDVTEKIDGLCRVKSWVLSGLENKYKKYREDPDYSPIMITFRKQNGSSHALLIIGRDPEDRYIVIDPAAQYRNGRQVVAETVLLDKRQRKICASSHVEAYDGAEILQCYQWYISRDD